MTDEEKLEYANSLVNHLLKKDTSLAMVKIKVCGTDGVAIVRVKEDSFEPYFIVIDEETQHLITNEDGKALTKDVS